LLEAHESLRDAFFNVNVFDLDGKLVASLRDRNARRVNISGAAILQGHHAAAGRRDFRALQKHPVGTAGGGADAAAARCRRQTDRHPAGRDRPVAPLVLGQLDALRAGADGYLFIVTDQGITVHHPDKSRILEKATTSRAR
jgi:phosphoserine phosphatase